MIEQSESSEPTSPGAAPEATQAPAEVPPSPPADEALPKQPNIITRLVRAIDRAIAANPKRTGHPQVCAMLLDTSGYGRAIITDKERALLVELQRKHKQNLDLLMNHSHEAVHGEWQKHLSELQDSIQAGNISEIPPKSREQFEFEQQRRLESAVANMRAIYREAHPICNKVANKFIYCATVVMEGREKNDRESQDYFGIPPAGPSSLVIAFRKAIEFAKSRVVYNEYGEASPEQMLPYIDL